MNYEEIKDLMKTKKDVEKIYYKNLAYLDELREDRTIKLFLNLQIENVKMKRKISSLQQNIDQMKKQICKHPIYFLQSTKLKKDVLECKYTIRCIYCGETIIVPSLDGLNIIHSSKYMNELKANIDWYKYIADEYTNFALAGISEKDIIDILLEKYK
ncbi:MAG: hypothetical protein RR702_05585 [Clostridia bacterium]